MNIDTIAENRPEWSMYYTYGVLPDLSGGQVHIQQFIQQSVAHNWRLWGPPDSSLCGQSGLTPLPRSWPRRLRILRHTDVIYSRVEDRIVSRRFSPAACHPWKHLAGNPLVAWEFNTVPEYGQLQGQTAEELSITLTKLRQAARDCDVAFCVSEKIAEYVAKVLNIGDTVVVPNGSDPERFSPHLPPCRHALSADGCLHAVWMGTGSIAWHDFDLLHDIAECIWQRGYGSRIRLFVLSDSFPRFSYMPPNVVFAGQQSYDDLPFWLSGMHVGLCLYRRGPAEYCSPLKLYDYMASGLAVLSTPQPQVEAVMKAAGQSQAIWESASGFADALIAMQCSLEATRRRGQSLRTYLIQNCTWKHTVERILGELQRRK